MVVALVDEGDFDRRAAQRLRGGKTAEAGADDDDARARHRFNDRGHQWRPRESARSASTPTSAGRDSDRTRRGRPGARRKRQTDPSSGRMGKAWIISADSSGGGDEVSEVAAKAFAARRQDDLALLPQGEQPADGGERPAHLSAPSSRRRPAGRFR